MSYTKNEGMESLRRSLLLMSYDNKKTLSENVDEILSEQGFAPLFQGRTAPAQSNRPAQSNSIDTIYNELKSAVGGAGTNERDLQNAIDKLTSIADYNTLNTKISQTPIDGSKNLQEILNSELGISDARTAAYIQRKLKTIGIDMTYGANNTNVFTNSIRLKTSGGSGGSGGGTGARRSKYIPVGKNDCVINIQTFLKNQGISLGPKDVDGIYGPYTIRAVQEYQRKNNLTADGIWGPATAAKTGNQVLPCGVTQTNTNQTITNPTGTTNNELGTTKIDPRNVYDRINEPNFNVQPNPKLDLSSPTQTTTQSGMEMYNQLNKQGLIGPVRGTNGRKVKYTGQDPLPTEVSKYLSDLGYIQRRNNEWIKR